MRGIPEPGTWLPAALALRLASIAVALAFARRPRASRRAAFAGSCLASLLVGALAVNVLATGRPLHGELFQHAASGFALEFAVDRLSAWFLTVLAVLAIPIAVYSVAYLGHGTLDRRSSALASTSSSAPWRWSSPPMGSSASCSRGS